ncbi:MAG: OmpA family protein [Phycisphaerae bacterium]|nr:OmpA family protein [Phycisphaerae bacterium]
MKRTIYVSVALLGLVATIFAGGCTDYKAQSMKLRNQNDLLKVDNDNLRGQVQDKQNLIEEMDLLVKSKEDTIVKKNEKISRLESQLGQSTDVKITATGWETGTFGDKISVGSDVLFGSGKATLTKTGRRALSRVVRDIKSTYPGLPVRVYGFTDSDPIRKSKRKWKDNLDLSANRAMAVTRYLIGNGISKDNIETVAMGATHFVSSNKTRTGKSKNRRVDIMVVK